jgi:2-dehydro-3-deoxygalactonokinase
MTRRPANDQGRSLSGTLIGVDWGGSRLRAFRYDQAGEVVETREHGRALLDIGPSGFEATLRALIADWLGAGAAQLMLCGMVGSRQGWMEAPYVFCPADVQALVGGLVPLVTALGEAQIVPGVALETEARADVMRGEETQIIGSAPADWTGVAIAPGTHSKWVTLERGRINGFRTWMTGELHGLIMTHTLVGALAVDGPIDPSAFDLGVRRAREDPAITSLLFGARAETLLGRIVPDSLSGYVSGLLIGAEVAQGLENVEAGASIFLIGAPELTVPYARALSIFGRAAAAIVDGATASAKGLWRLHQLAGGFS